MNEAHVFQHNYTGVQYFVYYCKDELSSRVKLMQSNVPTEDVIYVGKKIATNVD